MNKEETVKHYREAFLAGRTPAYALKFDAKSVNNQYASIMTWRRKNRQAATEPQGNAVVEQMRSVRTMAMRAKDLTATDIDKLEVEANELLRSLGELRITARERELRMLESEREALENRIQRLLRQE